MARSAAVVDPVERLKEEYKAWKHAHPHVRFALDTPAVLPASFKIVNFCNGGNFETDFCALGTGEYMFGKTLVDRFGFRTSLPIHPPEKMGQQTG